MQQPIPSDQDFFDCSLFAAIPYFKDDMASMEHPVFSLSTKPDMRHLRYEHNGNTLEIIPSGYGLATIHDKDILLYCASQLRSAINDGCTPNQAVRFTAHDFFIATKRRTSGEYYRNFEISLNRLRSTTIKTTIKTTTTSIKAGFGLIDSWRIIEKGTDDRMAAIEIKLSDWLYNAILANELLTINRDYFTLRKPLERRIYELTRKHCGDQKSWKIALDLLKKKTGSGSNLREFRRMIGKLTETNHLPDYHLFMGGDIIAFKTRKSKTQDNHISLLMTETFEKAKKAAPGWDIYFLEREWREWLTNRDEPKNPSAAFIAFCRKKCQRQARP